MAKLIEEFSNEPKVAERVCDASLKHTENGSWAEGFVLVELDRAALGSTGSDSSLLDGDGVVDEELDADSRETRRFWGACTVKRRLFGEEERRAADGEASDGMAFVDGPEKLRAESVLVESDGGFGVVDSEHRERFEFAWIRWRRRMDVAAVMTDWLACAAYGARQIMKMLPASGQTEAYAAICD